MDYDNVAATYGYALVYAGLKANCYVKREEADFDFEKVCEWVDEMDLSDISKIRECFETTQTFKKLTEAMTPESESQDETQAKKKQRNTTPKPTK